MVWHLALFWEADPTLSPLLADGIVNSVEAKIDRHETIQANIIQIHGKMKKQLKFFNVNIFTGNMTLPAIYPGVLSWRPQEGMCVDHPNASLGLNVEFGRTHQSWWKENTTRHRMKKTHYSYSWRPTLRLAFYLSLILHTEKNSCVHQMMVMYKLLPALTTQTLIPRKRSNGGESQGLLRNQVRFLPSRSR